MRDEAALADIVIVNHHLLCADASIRQSPYGEVIPECDLAVIDEAHQLEDVVTQYFGVSVGTRRVDDFVRDTSRAIRALGADDGPFAVACARGLSDVERAARAFFEEIRAEAGDRRPATVCS